jgi:Dyp-type peroxidase family
MLELNDIQGIIIRGYSKLRAAHFLLLSASDAGGARQWLSRIRADITPGHVSPEESAMHIAFTYEGLRAIGLQESVLDSFPLEFGDGMTGPHKQFFLGDFADSAAGNWEWGGPNTPAVHILLMFYAKDAELLERKVTAVRASFDHCGIQEVRLLGTAILYKQKEHFGFHDGISQPTLKGLKRSDDDENCIEPGEFILGYKNEYGQLTPRPVAAAATDPGNLLPSLPQGSAHDLGLNGTYLVFRQLKQDVPLFWNFMAKATQMVDGSRDENAMIKLASQIVGRWPDGTPLVLSPDKPGGSPEKNNAFDYRQSDPDGLKCPFAAHIRRSNPKDSLDTDRTTSIAIAKKHRILRRGRSYGPPLTEELKPLDCLDAAEGAVERGLHFMCINADISRQFEFLQNGWINNQKFNGLYDERDPLIANHHNPQDARKTGTFRIPGDGLRTRITDLPEFVQVKGGAYFFIPGLRALSFLANLKA